MTASNLSDPSALEDRAVALALDTLSPAERAEVEALLAAHPDGARLRREAAEIAAGLGLALPPLPPRSAARTRLLADAAPRPRAPGLVAPLAGFLDVGAAAARRALAVLDDPAAWIAAPLAGVALCDLDGGPRVADARVGLVRVAPGVTFPHHDHFGDEFTLVLQGGWRDDRGQILRRGETLHLGPGTAHAFTALSGPDLVFAVVLRGGISLPGFE
jgi:putative transcriptional regulator